MSNDLLYRIAAALLFLTMAIIGFFFRIKAHKAGDNTDRKDEGSFIMISLRLFGFGTWLAVILLIVGSASLEFSSFYLTPAAHSAGAIVLLFTNFLIYRLFKAIGTNITDTVGIKEEHKLIQTGPYKYIRHPLYSASILIFVGYGLLLSNWMIMVLGTITFILLCLRLPKEEANLSNRFGESYDDYSRSTPRFLPRLTKRELQD